MAPQSLIGQDIPRLDALEKVTGAARYIADIAFPAMLHGRVLRSDRPHALIRRIDTAAARAVPGVRAVITGADFPFNVGIYMVDQYIFAMERVRYVGEPVAAVAAATPAAAEKALRRIVVEYEDLPALLDVEEAARPGAVLIHPEIGSYQHVGAILPRADSNVANHFKVRKGDPDGAMAQAHLVLQNCFVVPQVQHVPLEPHGAIAWQDESGRLTVWSSTQSPFTVRYLLSHCFGLKIHEIRCLAPYVGGGFGAKAGINLEPIAAALAMAARGRPVKLIASREEEFHAIVVRQGLRARIKTGLAGDGRILAEEVELLWDCGAYAGYGVNIVRAAGYTIGGAYHVPNLRGDSLGIYTNRPVGSAYRGFGMQELHWAMEGQIDLCARAMG
ncbi:MAG: xanthine dehydrogenase family protein molybdopterin-binding subunit, partial [Deltaproteobacteria bacterium]|nr:xanthine dehydrogenase family protein molybdopterin-binding subunit [Deltaproteobacteria bacterium]